MSDGSGVGPCLGGRDLRDSCVAGNDERCWLVSGSSPRLICTAGCGLVRALPGSLLRVLMLGQLNSGPCAGQCQFPQPVRLHAAHACSQPDRCQPGQLWLPGQLPSQSWNLTGQGTAQRAAAQALQMSPTSFLVVPSAHSPVAGLHWCLGLLHPTAPWPTALAAQQAGAPTGNLSPRRLWMCTSISHDVFGSPGHASSTLSWAHEQTSKSPVRNQDPLLTAWLRAGQRHRLPSAQELGRPAGVCGHAAGRPPQQRCAGLHQAELQPARQRGSRHQCGCRRRDCRVNSTSNAVACRLQSACLLSGSGLRASVPASSVSVPSRSGPGAELRAEQEHQGQQDERRQGCPAAAWMLVQQRSGRRLQSLARGKS